MGSAARKILDPQAVAFRRFVDFGISIPYLPLIGRPFVAETSRLQFGQKVRGKRSESRGSRDQDRKGPREKGRVWT